MNYQTIISIIISVGFVLLGVNQTSNDPFPKSTNIQTLVTDFIVEDLLSGEGEFLSITTDPQGRLIISPRFGKVLRATVTDRVEVDTLDLGVQDCQGMLYAHNHLYLMGTGPDDVRGVYKCSDPSGMGDYEHPELLKEFPKNGDHSGHTIALGPDSMIYFLSGNVNRIPEGDDIQYINEDWHIDHPMMMGSIYGGDQKSPGGFVLRTDPDGTQWTLYAMGLRNPYDMCFNAEGELFTFDSDMEWDFNLPWYRPIRVNHLVSGGDYAWRPFNAKRFDSYPDVWPAVIDLGRGSPTATCFGSGTNFPPKYQKALFLGDWSYGKIYALHLEDTGSTYKGSHEIFATGKPLNITDMTVGNDGHLYFVTGGNGTDTGLFRIRYTGEAYAPIPLQSKNELRSIRHKLESFHTSTDTSGLSAAIQYLGHEDEFIRKAARMILERNNIELWKHHVTATMNQNAKTEALITLIRKDSTEKYFALILELLQSYTFADLSDEEQIGYNRILSLLVQRYNSLDSITLKNISQLISPFYPSPNDEVNKELSRTLASIYITLGDISGFIPTSIKLIEVSEDSKMIIHYMEVLRHIPGPWSVEERLAYRYWSDYAIKNWSGGSLFTYFVKQIRSDFESHIRKDELIQLDEQKPSLLNVDYKGPFTPSTTVQRNASTALTFIKNWTYSDLEYSLELVNSPRSSSERNLQRGYQMLEQGQCYTCHYILDRGGAFGPELTLASNSFGVEELTRTILYPSEAINTRFQATEFRLKENGFIRGRIVNESETHYVVQLDWFGNATEEIPKESIISLKPSMLSDMPPGLINTMKREEILDMLYFITELPGKQADTLAFDILSTNTVNPSGDTAFVEILNYSKSGNIFYSINDGNELPYNGPFVVMETSNITAYKELEDTVSDSKNLIIDFYDPQENGLQYQMYFSVENRFDIENQKPDIIDTTYNFDMSLISQDRDNYLTVFDGYLEIEAPGEYFFHARFNDALQFFVDDKPIVINTKSNWGGQGSRCIFLKKGRVPVKVMLFDQLGMEFLQIEYEGPNISRQKIFADKLYLHDNSK